MQEYKKPLFQKGRVLKKEGLDALRDFPSGLAEIFLEAGLMAYWQVLIFLTRKGLVERDKLLSVMVQYYIKKILSWQTRRFFRLKNLTGR